MLKDVPLPRTVNGATVSVPVEMTDRAIEPLVRLYIEMADYNPQDGSGVLARFRGRHGRDWTLRVLGAILDELHHPSIALNIKGPRVALLPFFEALLERHSALADADFSSPRDQPPPPS